MKINLPVLVLNKLRAPIHIKRVRDAICDVSAEDALFVDPDLCVDGQILNSEGTNYNPTFGQLYSFAEWIELTDEHLFAAQCGERPVPKILQGAKCQIKIPEVILLPEYDEVPDIEIRLTRANVMLRDKSRCQYCNKKLTKDTATLDHVHPRCRGGKHTWTNVVICCFSCNVRKGDKDVWDVNMKLANKPVKPDWYPLSTRFSANSPESWVNFVRDFNKLRSAAKKGTALDRVLST
jgi:5-methylcytosine-specific restriction endonuclease McrA